MSVPCTDHCRACGRHFHSTAAFDAHLSRNTPDGPATGCLAPDIDDEVAQLFIGFEGECDISHPPQVEVGVVFELVSRRQTVRVRRERAAAA